MKNHRFFRILLVISPGVSLSHENHRPRVSTSTVKSPCAQINLLFRPLPLPLPRPRDSFFRSLRECALCHFLSLSIYLSLSFFLAYICRRSSRRCCFFPERHRVDPMFRDGITLRDPAAATRIMTLVTRKSSRPKRSAELAPARSSASSTSSLYLPPSPLGDSLFYHDFPAMTSKSETLLDGAARAKCHGNAKTGRYNRRKIGVKNHVRCFPNDYSVILSTLLKFL